MRHQISLKTLLSLGLLIGLSGCSWVWGAFGPTPGHVERVPVSQDATNAELADTIVAALTEDGIINCDRDCPFAQWPGNSVSVDRDMAIVEIGDFPAYSSQSIFYSARIRRSFGSEIQIHVKGWGVYYTPAPLEEISGRIAEALRDRL